MICTGSNEHTTNLKISEAFYYGLSERSKIEMARLNIHDINEMFLIIESTEKTMIEQMESHSRQQPWAKNNSKKHNLKTNLSKWCDHHKMNTHNTFECRAVKRKDSIRRKAIILNIKPFPL
ncbi:hypothetical protein DMUE_3220 [Dictyocoela muelleri]|nr:hypothetical protein DMUE_3220 [Dictyocoela muelleri]